MKIEKLTQNCYRVRKQIMGNRISLTFDHKPSEREIYKKLSEMDIAEPTKGSFEQCAISYIESKSNVLSPKTYKEYYHRSA